MAIRLRDSFDYFATADITKVFTQIYTDGAGGGGSSDLQIGAYGRRSTSAIRFSCNASVNRSASPVGVTLPATGAVCGIFCAFTHSGAGFANLFTGTSANPSTSAAGSITNCLFNIRQGGANHTSLRVNTDGTLSYLRGTNTYTVIATSVNALQVGVTYALHSVVTIDNAAGEVTLLVNGDEWIAATSVDTQDTASATWNEVVFGHLAITGGGVTTWDIDDLVIWDSNSSDATNPATTLPSDVRVDYRLLTADGAFKQFTPSTGSTHYTLLDEVPASLTDYIGSSTPGVRDTFTAEGVALPGAGLLGVEIVYLAQRMEAGTSSTAAVIRLGSTTYDGTAEGNASSETYQRQYWGRRPSDLAEWTESDYETGQYGVKKAT